MDADQIWEILAWLDRLLFFYRCLKAKVSNAHPVIRMVKTDFFQTACIIFKFPYTNISHPLKINC